MDDIKSCGIAVPHILIPDEKINMKKWSVVACDQFVYDRAYWESVDRLVGNAPSTLRMMLPETYLNEGDVAERIEETRETMYDYIEAGVLKELPEGFMLVERMIAGKPRLGLVVLLDLEEYEFDADMKPLIRPTEQTIKDRIPPRMQIRMGAPAEMPHILALIDDPGQTVIEPVYDIRSKFKKLYDFELMQDGGRISGFFVDDPACIEGVMSAMAALPDHDGMKIAVGDGNHSLATAKEVWNRAKQALSPEEAAASPLRYALCELINLHDPALEISPIHRAVVGANPSSCIQYIVDKLNQRRLGARLIFSRRKRLFGSKDGIDPNKTIYFASKESMGRIELTSLSHVMMMEDLQPVLEQMVADMPSVKLNYIHGDAKIEEMAQNYDTLCFTLPAIDKSAFMDTVVRCGVLPKKSFSLGEENEKRYYLESRLLIIPEDEPEQEPEEPVAEDGQYAAHDLGDADDAFDNDYPNEDYEGARRYKHDGAPMREEFADDAFADGYNDEESFIREDADTDEPSGEELFDEHQANESEPIEVITDEAFFEEAPALPEDALELEQLEVEDPEFEDVVLRPAPRMKKYRDELDELVDGDAGSAEGADDPADIIE